MAKDPPPDFGWLSTKFSEPPTVRDSADNARRLEDKANQTGEENRRIEEENRRLEEAKRGLEAESQKQHDGRSFGGHLAGEKKKEQAEMWHEPIRQLWPELKHLRASQAEIAIRSRNKKGEITIPALPRRDAVLRFLYTLPK